MKKYLANRTLLLISFILISLIVNAKEKAGLRKTTDKWAIPSNALFIDPSQPDGQKGDGSKNKPFRSLQEIRWSADNTYLLKRGTTDKCPAMNINGDNITLGAYGTGEPPIIQCTSKAVKGRNSHLIRMDSGKNFTLRDIAIEAPGATSCLRLGGGCHEIQVLNCRMSGSMWGIRAFSFKGLEIDNTEIFDIGDDGVFVVNVTHIEISHCYIHKVNTRWVPPYTSQKIASGDSIQFVDCNSWHVHHCILDRTNSGNKFCFISNNSKQDKGIFEYNLTRGPLTSGDGGSAIYLGGGDGIIVRNNTILGPAPSALYSHSSNLKFNNNEIRKTSGGVYVSGSAVISNNNFNCLNPDIISGGSIQAQNNTFQLPKGAKSPFGKIKKLTESNNKLISK